MARASTQHAGKRNAMQVILQMMERRDSYVRFGSRAAELLFTRNAYVQYHFALDFILKEHPNAKSYSLLQQKYVIQRWENHREGKGQRCGEAPFCRPPDIRTQDWLCSLRPRALAQGCRAPI